MIRLALDLGTKTGWALSAPRQPIAHGMQSFAPRRFDGGGMRFLRFQRWLDELRGNDGFASVHFEEVRRHMGVDAAHVYGGLLGVLSAWCEQHGIPYEGVPVGTIKRHATGKGNAKKEAMIAAAKANGFSRVTDDNEADAIALLRYVMSRDAAQ